MPKANAKRDKKVLIVLGEDYWGSRGRVIIQNDKAKKTTVCRRNPKAVGHPSRATPGMMLFTTRKVIGFATKKKISAE
jgi:hypothetical protein